jgi:predicted short-subunit dehydrogenase-like oxidoreductase (DUF2520 family)
LTRWGLAAAGSVSRSFLPRVPSLARRLGPVGSTSYRLAARIVNGFKAGVAVRDMRALDECSLILLCAPGGSIARVASALSAADLHWQGKTLLLCDSGDYSCDFPEFRELGAAVGSINPVEGLTGRYVIEGHREALRYAKLLVRELSGKPIEIPSDRMRMFDAARTLAGSLFTPLIETCVECIRQAGITGPAASTIAEALLQRTLRAFMYAGRKSWSGPVARADRAVIDRECRALMEAKPLMGKYFGGASDFALELYQTFPELTRYNQARWERE